MPYRIIVGFFMVLFTAPYLAAQKTVRTSYEPQKIKHYKGRIDDINDITVSLDCVGKTCTGELTYVRSRDYFRLKGTLNGQELQLKELDKTNKCTGYLNGKVEGNVIELQWRNKTGTVGNKIALKEVARKPDFPTFCGDNKWINAYAGKINGETVNIILQRMDNYRILGSAYFSDKQKKVLLKGELSENDNLHLSFIDEHTAEQIGTIRGVYQAGQNLNVSYYNNQNAQNFVTLHLEQQLGVSCLEYADFYTNYDFLFPKSNNAIFNEVMVVLTKDWIEDCRRNVQRIRKTPADAQTRASQRAYSWTDIAFLDANFISGMLTYHATWQKGEITKTFNYDLANSEAIELTDIFKKGFDYQNFLKKYAAEEIIKHPIYKNNSAFRDWLKAQEFTFFTLEEDGISFYTDFHIIYDRQRIFIPYKKLKGNIRKNAGIRKLF